jgi:hypothetical protein
MAGIKEPMTGISGLGDRATGGRQSVDALDLANALNHAGLRVRRENVLGLRADFLQEAYELQDTVYQKRRRLDVGLCGGDPVSPEARDAFQECFDLLLDQIQLRVEVLKTAGAELGATARAYGLAEDAIEASFAYVPPVPAGGHR